MPRSLTPDNKERKSRSVSKKSKRDRRNRSTSSDSSSSRSSSSASSSSSSPSRRRKKRSKKKSSSSKDRRKRKRSSSSSSSSPSPSRKKKQKKDKKEKKRKKKEKKKKRKKEKEKERRKSAETAKNDVVLADAGAAKTAQPPAGSGTSVGPKPRIMKPMTKEEWEKQQSVMRHVYDEESGRTRLIKGDGEVMEEIVSKERHKEINKISTEGDGRFFASKMGLLGK